jgi:hypothetical protein
MYISPGTGGSSRRPGAVRVDRLSGDVGLDIGSELGAVLSRGGGGIAFERAIDHLLWETRIERPRCSFGDKDQSIAARSKVAPEGLPHRATARIRGTDDDQWPARCGQHRPGGGKDLDVRIRGRLIAPEGGFVCHTRDGCGAPDLRKLAAVHSTSTRAEREMDSFV